MRILFVTSNFPPNEGGIAAFDYHICRELHDQGHSVVVIANCTHGSYEFDSKQRFVIKRLNHKIRPTSFETIFYILLLVLKEKIDIIFFGHFNSTHWFGGVLAKKFFNKPYVILVHGNEFSAYFHRFTRIDGWASRIVLRNTDGIIVNSNATKNLVKAYQYPEGRIYIIYPGVDAEQYKTGDKNQELVRQLGLDGKTILLTAARLVPIKNHANVLKALASVVRSFPNVAYLIVGKGVEEEKLRTLTKELCLEDVVKFVGYIEPEKILRYFNICDVFIMPSTRIGCEYESFGIVYLEANACGKPVIAGIYGGSQDAVINGETGILVDPDNIDAISSAILQLLANRNYAEKLGKNGRQRVERELSWSIVGKKVEVVLKKIVNKGELAKFRADNLL